MPLFYFAIWTLFQISDVFGIFFIIQFGPFLKNKSCFSPSHPKKNFSVFRAYFLKVISLLNFFSYSVIDSEVCFIIRSRQVGACSVISEPPKYVLFRDRSDCWGSIFEKSISSVFCEAYFLRLVQVLQKDLYSEKIKGRRRAQLRKK